MICTALTVCMMCFGACGQPYELILADSAAEAERTGTAEAERTGVPEPESMTAAEESSSQVTAGGKDTEPDSAAEYAQSVPEADSTEPEEICVYVCGAVQKAGVYTLAAGSRVYEAVAAAGGLTEEAEPRALNQAQLLEDGQQITVYTKEEIAQDGDSLTAGSISSGTGGASGGSGGAADGSRGGSAPADNVVNLNTADRDELMTLTGVGEARADAIIAYREENGAFSSAEEIMQIDGIGQKSYEKLKDRITV